MIEERGRAKESERAGEMPDDDLSPSPSLPLSLSIPAEAAGQRLDLFLAAQFNMASRSAIQRAISDGKILVNAQQIKPSHRLSAGELIAGTIPQAPPIEAQAENISLDIVYEDDALIVVNKPAGMVTHPGAGVKSGTLANALVYHLQQQ